jgi:hypothetical protein
MRNDVHFAALRAAAKVAFSMALLNGCASPDPNEKTSDNGEGDEALSTSNAAVTTADKDCPAEGCDALLASKFPGQRPYQWKKVPQSAEVVSCCKKEIGTKGVRSHYRWDCCVAFDPETGDSAWNGAACTPWGPPVPPSMDRLAKRRARRAAAQASMAVVA